MPSWSNGDHSTAGPSTGEHDDPLKGLASFMDEHPDILAAGSTWRSRGGLDLDLPLPSLHLDEPPETPPPSDDEADASKSKPISVYKKDNTMGETGSDHHGRSGSMGSLKSQKSVRFTAGATGASVSAKGSKAQQLWRCLSCKTECKLLDWMAVIVHFWANWVRKAIVVGSLYGLWSMGIWLGFLTEPRMAGTLQYVLVADGIANTAYLLDKIVELIEMLMVVSARKRDSKQGSGSRRFGRRASTSSSGGFSNSGMSSRDVNHVLGQHTARCNTLPQLALAIGMYPVQILLWNMLKNQDYPLWLVAFVLLICLMRVGWAAKDSMDFINRKELDVYVDIRIHGTTSASNRWKVVAKQFLIVLFWGHWVGCLSYAMRSWSMTAWGIWILGWTRGLPRGPDGARDYFQHFEDQGQVAGYMAGAEFGGSYVLSLYKGFHWNFEDIVPERPEELLLEVLVSAGLVCIRSYCIGSFFKYHQKKEDEMQQFNELMESVRSYMELCELPPSLRKETILHFRFQQAKRREAQTLEVLAMLPLEAQKKLKEHEYLPIVLQRNPHLFGSGITYDFAMQVVMILEPRFMQPSEVIFMEGDTARELVFLDTGSVALSRLLQLGGAGKMSDHLMYYLRADRKEDPTCLGEAAFLLEHPHLYSARVRAGLDAVMLCLPKGRFDEELAGVYPEQYEILVRNMAEMLMLDIYGNTTVHTRERTAEHDSEHFLAIQGVVRRLLQKRQESLNAAFTYAASTGNAKLVRELLGKRVDVNSSDYDKRSAMHLAASEGMQEALEALLVANGEANLKDRWGSTPLQDALAHGSQGAAKLLQRHHAELGLEDPSGVLCTCASEGDITRMQQLLDFGVDLNAGDYDKRTALHLAATEGRLTEVAFLVSRSADLNTMDRWNSTPLMDSIRHGFPTVAAHLRANGGQIDIEFAANLLCDAASTGNLAQIRMLIDNGVNVNDGDYDMRTAVHLAAAEGQLLAISYLVNVANANPSPKDRWEGTPLQDALQGGHEMCAHFLLAEGGSLGPSATPEMKKEVTRLKNEWFKEGGKAFYTRASTLRQKIATHTQLVKEGRARSDIFELEEAKSFNDQLVFQQVSCMKDLGKNLGWLVTLLQRLDNGGVTPMSQLLRLLEDGEALDSEAQFWQRMRMERGKREKRGKAKDAVSHVLDEVLFGTTALTPSLAKVVTKCVKRVLARVDQMNEGRMLAPGDRQKQGKQGMLSDTFSSSRADLAEMRSAHSKHTFGHHLKHEDESHSAMPRLSEVVVEELFKALGWEGGGGVDGGGHHRGSAGGGVGMGLAALQGTGGSARQRAISRRVEDLAAHFLPMEHVTNTFIGGVLKPRVCGEGTVKPQGQEFARWLDMKGLHQPWAGLTSTHSKGVAMDALSELSKWTEESSQRVIGLKEGMKEAPAALNTAPLTTLAYAPLWCYDKSAGADGPRASQHTTLSRNSERNQPAAVTQDGQAPALAPEPNDHYTEEARRKLVASELVLVALTALVMEAWDKNPNPQRGITAKQRAAATAKANSKGGGGAAAAGGGGGGQAASFQQQLNLKSRLQNGTYSDTASSVGSGSDDGAARNIQPETFEHLARVIGKAAWACRGEAATRESQRQAIQAQERKHLREERRQEKKNQRKTKQSVAASSKDRLKKEADERAAKAKQEAKEHEQLDHENMLNIQMAKILGLHGTVDSSDLAMLIDFSDQPQEVDADSKDDSQNSFLFGPVSRQRFALNMMRWILGQDERQSNFLENSVPHAGSNCLLRRMPSTASITTDASGSEMQGAHTRETLSDGRVVELKWEQLRQYRDSELGKEHSDGGGEDSDGELEDEEGAEVVEQVAQDGPTLDVLTLDGLRGGLDASVSRRGSQMSMRSLATNDGRGALISALFNNLYQHIRGSFGREGRLRRKQQWVAKRFRELDEDGEGIGVVDVAKLLGAAYHHTLGHEQELRAAQRIFELLERDEIGELVTLPELLRAMPQLEEELREQARKRRHVTADSEASWRVTRILSWMVVPPDAWWLPLWDQIKMAVCVYYMIEVPIRFCFVSMDHMHSWEAALQTALNVSADLFMLANTTLNFFRSFVHPTRGFVTNFREIRVHYLLNYFFLDALACCPADYLLWSTEGFTTRGPFARLVPAARLLRLLHMRQLVLADKLNFMSESEEQRRRMTEGFFKTAWFLLKIVMAMIHFVACIWWYLGSRFDSFDSDSSAAEMEMSQNTTERWSGIERWSWIYGYEARPGEPQLGDETGRTPFWWQYLISFYWSAGRITGLGTVGEMFPGSLWELGWSCVVFLMGFAISGYVDGILAGKVITRDEDAIEARATQRIVEDFLQTVELPEQLAAQIRATAGASAEAHQGHRVEEVARRLPHPLKLKIARRAFLPYFALSEIFEDCTDCFLGELGVCCRILQASRNSLLAYAGEPATRLLILCRGRIGFVDGQGRTLAKTSKRGEMVGHMPLLFETKHVMGATTLEESKLICISRADFQAICKLYPGDRIAMRRNLIKVLEGKYDGDGGMMSEAGSSVPDLQRALSKALSQGQTSSRGTGTGSGSNSGYSNESSSKRSGLSRMYALDLSQVREKANQEQVQARQQQICNMIDYACNGELARLEEVLSKGDLQVDEGDYDSRTALHLAVCGGHLDVVKFLVESYGASLTVKDRFGHTPMDDAVREQRMDVAKYLLERGARYQVDADVAGSLCQAAHDCDLDSLKLLLEVVGVDPNTADYDRRTALHLAASQGHAKIVDFMVNLPGINVNVKDRFGNTPQDDSLRHRHAECRRLLQAKGGEMGDQQVGVHLCTLASVNDWERLKELNESGVPMSQGDYDARTALHLAASEGKLEAATYIVNEAKVNVNPLDRFLSTPLDDAVRHGRRAIESLLREHGGLPGNHPKMKEEVERFQEFQKGERARKARAKLEREMKGTEISSLSEGLERLVSHPTLEEDVHTYVANAAAFRCYLLQMLRMDALEEGDEEDSDDDELRQIRPDAPTQSLKHSTKLTLERMMDQAGIAADVAASRLVLVLETELLQWTASLSKSESKLLSIYVPHLREVVLRLRDQLKARNDVTRAVHKLWQENGKSGAYHCTAIGLLMHRLSEWPMTSVAEARMDAMCMLFSSRPENLINTAIEQAKSKDNAAAKSHEQESKVARKRTGKGAGEHNLVVPRSLHGSKALWTLIGDDYDPAARAQMIRKPS